MNDATQNNPATGLPVAVTGDITEDASNRLPVFEMDIPIRWADMDYQRHVNNVMYFRYMEQARISWIDAMDVRNQEEGVGPVVINAFCSFLRQLHYPGTVRARLSVAQFGRSSVMTFVDMYRADEPGVIYASGGAKLVWINYEQGKSTPLPDLVRQRMRHQFGLLQSK
jgi:acyl-CoA thioester hydrolase